MNKFFLMFAAFIFVSCSTFNTETEIKESSVKDYKKSGIIFRQGKSSALTKKDYESGLKIWSDGYNKINGFLIVDNAGDKISLYDSEDARFYQLSDENEFLIIKSRGIIADFYSKNQEELKSIISSNALDSLIIFEIDSFYSSAIQKTGFDSVMVVLDADGNISYLNHQYDTFNLKEFLPDPVKSKRNLLDKVCERILEEFLKLDYIEEK